MKPLALFLAMITTITATAAPSLYDIPLKSIDEKDTSLKEHQGKVLLIVNVASRCGYTRQYSGLEKVYNQYKSKGLVIAGFPCNDFGAQEPGTNEEIKQFCSSKYSVTFPLYDKLHVKGPEKHPLYKALTEEPSPVPGDVKWNFGKFLVSRDGKILKRFDSGVEPDSKELTAAIEAALGK